MCDGEVPPGTPYTHDLLAEFEGAGQCVLCHSYFLYANLHEVDLDEPGNARLVCAICLERERSRCLTAS